MDNPYIILNISESATNEEIEAARKRQLKLQCSVDENKKNENGEYVSHVINQAADDLLNPDKRREIDEKINNKNVPTLSDSSDKKLPQVILTSINDEIIENTQKIVIDRSFFSKKVLCRKLYIAVLNSNECLYLIENSFIHDDGESRFYLREYFSDTMVTPCYKVGKCSWVDLNVFEMDGFLAIAFPAYLMLPNSVIKKGKITENTLRKLFPIIRDAIKNDAIKLQKLFEEEKLKVYKK